MNIIKVKRWTKIPKDYTGILEYDNGTKYWYLNNKLHRVDGPAVEFVNGDKTWWLNGKRHRVDGPAVEYIESEYKITEYWINGEEVTKEAQEVLYGLYKLKGLL